MIPESARDAWLGQKPLPPRCRIGDVLTCEVHGDVRVSGLRSRGAVPWPMGRPLHSGSGGRVVVLTPELAEAVKRESETAIMRYLGVSKSVVQSWRRALDVPKHNEGTLRLKSTETGNPEVTRALNAHHPLNWTPEDDALLGRVSDREAAELTGRTEQAVATRRLRLGRPPVRQYAHRKPWTPEEDRIVLQQTARQACAATGRTVHQIKWRKRWLRRRAAE